MSYAVTNLKQINFLLDYKIRIEKNQLKILNTVEYFSIFIAKLNLK